MNNRKRITSKLYIVLGIAYATAMVVFVNVYFSEKKSVLLTLLVIGVELLVGPFLWAAFNFVDIYHVPDENRLDCFFHGTLLQVLSKRRIRVLPVTARWGMIRYTVAMLTFSDETNKRKIKFFIVDDDYFQMIKDLKME